MAVIQSVGMLYLMFVGVIKPIVTIQPWGDRLAIYLPLVHMGVMVVIFVLIPLTVILMTLFSIGEIGQS